MKLLHVDSSILGQNSASRELSAAIVARWQDAVPGLQVTYRDLDAAPLPHLSGGSLAGADATEAAAAERALQEFLEADVIVLGAPMYNFNIPSTLKAWIDRLAVAGRTFRYTENGPEGLAGGKQVIVAGAYGGFHPVDGGSNFIEPYLRFVFRFWGIEDVTFVTAEGLAVSPQQRSDSLASAHAVIRTPLAEAA
ncbi:MAG TPA: NAD(P)H-dependent oxidoreductase [Luteimonas sp.]|nr:NAD(P)H-dependent oxidoreductase [Luteimonas sp.]